MVLHPSHVGIEKVRDHAGGRGGGGVERRRGERERREERRDGKGNHLEFAKL